MRVLVLGGTGSMGVSLVESISLDSRVTKVDVTPRRKINSDGFVRYIQGNAHDSVFLDQLLNQKYDVIVDFMSYSTAEFNCRYEKFLNNTGQYFYMSSSRVYADSCGKKITEDSPRLLDVSNNKRYLSTDEYALAKARQEYLLFNSKTNNFTIIRPYITYNVNRLQLGVQEKEQWVNRVLSDKEIVFQKDIAESYTTLTYGFDVAKAIGRLIGNDRAIGQTYQIMTNESVKWRKILDIYISVIRELSGVDVNVLWQETSKEIIWVTNKYQVRCDRLYDRVFDNSKILNMCGNGFVFTRLEDGIRICLNELLNSNHNHSCGIKWDAFFDRASKKNQLSSYPHLADKLKYWVYMLFPHGVYLAKRVVNKVY